MTRIESEILDADACILPGVGAFAYGMKNLIEFNLPSIIKKYVQTGKPLLGICLGMQLLMDGSYEFGWTRGLGLVKGKVLPLSCEQGRSIKLPHVCWNEIQPPNQDRWEKTFLSKILAGENMYFVHSYAVRPEYAEDILSVTNYGGITFCSAIQHNNIIGVQFHPEKSGLEGLKILTGFASLSSQQSYS